MDMDSYNSHACVAYQPPPVPETPDEEGSSEDSNDQEANIIHKLIEAVQTRPPLWDHTLPLKVRAQDVREKLWREVFGELNGVIPLTALEKKWKNLRDTFLKNLKTYKPHSGVGLDEKKKWRHFDEMLFIQKVNAPRSSTTNVPLPEMSPVFAGSRAATEPVFEKFETPSSSRKRQKKNDDTDQLLLEILKEPPPPKPQTPQLSPALLTIQSIFDKLPERVRMRAEIDMLNKAYSLYDEYGATD